MLKLIPTPKFAEISETKTLKQILFHTAKKYLTNQGQAEARG